VDRRSQSYERLAFLGDSVLSLAVTTHLFPREDFGAGRLTKVRAQAVSGAACRRVAERLDVPRRLRAEAASDGAAPGRQGPSIDELVRSERVLASIAEAIIGACYLAFGYERVAPAVVEAFEPEIARALEHPVDFKSALQERLARRGDEVVYEVRGETGPPHRRTFEVAARVGRDELGTGSGRSKQEAEQAAAREALGSFEGAG